MHVPVWLVAQDPSISPRSHAILHSWLILYTKTMKLFADKFIQTLLFNIATIAAIVVAIVQFSIRAWKENNGTEKTRKVIQTVLRFVDKIVAQLQAFVDTDVPQVKVAQKKTKRAWSLVHYIRSWEIQWFS